MQTSNIWKELSMKDVRIYCMALMRTFSYMTVAPLLLVDSHSPESGTTTIEDMYCCFRAETISSASVIVSELDTSCKRNQDMDMTDEKPGNLFQNV